MTWHCKARGSYSYNSNEGYDNMAAMASKLMIDYGWTLEACAGMLGNVASEGGLNPWRWENDNVLSKSQAQSAGTGMGLIGWTPCRKYADPTNSYFPEWDLSTFFGYGPNYSDEAGNPYDGEAQTELIGKCMTDRGHRNFWIFGRSDIYGNSYNMRAGAFIELTNVETACLYWLWQAEYPTSIQPPRDPRQTEQTRISHARNIYQIFIDHGFTPTPGAGRFPLILLLAKKGGIWRNGL